MSEHMKNDELMWLWFGAALTFLFLAPILLFAVWQWVGPFGMLFSFACAYGCIFAGIRAGWRSVMYHK